MKKNTKDIEKQNEIWAIASALINDFEKYAKENHFTQDIRYDIYEEGNEYKIKIIKDEEKILQTYLERMDE